MNTKAPPVAAAAVEFGSGLVAEGARPIFVVGCARSGTTLLRMILDSHPNISAGEETHFLADFENLTGRYWEHLGSYDADRRRWLRRMAAFVDGVHSDYARPRGKRRWADKTPKYVLHLPFVEALFPTAQIVHVIRDGRDVVASHFERWGWEHALRCAVRKWRKSVEAGRRFGATAGAERYHEVRYEALVESPEATLRALFEFLGEPWDASVLAYDQKPHDAADRHLDLTRKRRAAGDGRLIYRSRVGAGGAALDPVLRTTLRVSSGKLLDELGYR